MSDEDEGGLPLGVMIVLLMLFVAAVGWGFAAGLYTAAEGAGPSSDGRVTRIRGRSVGAFVGNGVAQLGNAPAVVGYTLRNHLWLVGLFGALEVGLAFGYFKMKKIEERMRQPHWKRRRRS